jgi:uncharacterized membrane protein YuzA (DUF378 family)
VRLFAQNFFFVCATHNGSTLAHTTSSRNFEFDSAICKGDKMMILDRISLILTIVGALNWGSIGLFQFDIVAWICGGQSSLLSRIIYTVVGLAGVWCISLLFRARETFDRIED